MGDSLDDRGLPFVLVKTALLLNRRFSEARLLIAENNTFRLLLRNKTLKLGNFNNRRPMGCGGCGASYALIFSLYCADVILSPASDTCPQPAQRFSCSSCCIELDHFRAYSLTVDLRARKRKKRYPCNFKYSTLH